MSGIFVRRDEAETDTQGECREMAEAETEVMQPPPEPSKKQGRSVVLLTPAFETVRGYISAV